jgi:hypothetical protein
MNVMNPLGDDIQVDSQKKLHLNPTATQLSPPPFGTSTMAGNSDPKKKRRNSVFSRISTLVDAALLAYRSQLVSKGYVRSANPSLHFSRYLRRFCEGACREQDPQDLPIIATTFRNQRADFLVNARDLCPPARLGRNLCPRILNTTKRHRTVTLR